MKFILICSLLLGAVCCSHSQSQSAENHWDPFDFFVGSWEGHETGKAGIGKGQRSYEWIMDGRYLYGKNLSVFEPQEKNPEGEIHKDWSFTSYDKNRKKFILREFHSEGFVNQYTLDSLSSDHKLFIFISESSENAPPGLKAKLTLQIENNNRFVEIFELAFPGKRYSPYLRNYWQRKE